MITSVTWNSPVFVIGKPMAINKSRCEMTYEELLCSHHMLSIICGLVRHNRHIFCVYAWNSPPLLFTQIVLRCSHLHACKYVRTGPRSCSTSVSLTPPPYRFLQRSTPYACVCFSAPVNSEAPSLLQFRPWTWRNFVSQKINLTDPKYGMSNLSLVSR